MRSIKGFNLSQKCMLALLELKLLFSLFDTNHDGIISQNEIQNVIEATTGTSFQPEQLTAFMKLVDTDNSGDITIDEFTTLMNEHVQQKFLGLLELFNKFDVDKNGSVDKDEFEQIIKTVDNGISNEQIDLFTSLLDKNDSGNILFIKDTRFLAGFPEDL
ncbi:unnamed protein product [Didymodactylos carnosus]|uniref:EF-hand domain-containing protein n=1 Tax=Didymodactylos carnosus TaxID=1234261 RepID=A0A815J3S5_9BILA|nr:unnamed protein product [Didymodactylos carnosus]CAF4263170.1 unnamed protein product [Didymodactylos carnosus]